MHPSIFKVAQSFPLKEVLPIFIAYHRPFHTSPEHATVILHLFTENGLKIFLSGGKWAGCIGKQTDNRK